MQPTHAHKLDFDRSKELKRRVVVGVEYLGGQTFAHLRSAPSQRLADALARESLLYLYRLIVLLHMETSWSGPGRDHPEPVNSCMRLLGKFRLQLSRTPEDCEEHRLQPILHAIFALLSRSALPCQTARWVPHDLFSNSQTPTLFETPLHDRVLRNLFGILELGIADTSCEEPGPTRSPWGISSLNIRELGAVYEGLLSYTGTITTQRGHELRSPRDRNDTQTRTFFVPESQIHLFPEKMRICSASGGTRVIEPGTFLFRLTGRSRRSSASFYTPRALTRALTQLTLAQHLKSHIQEQGLHAKDILELRICDPAMGAGAMLCEAAEQLSTIYLEKLQEETGVILPPFEYKQQKKIAQRHLVGHACFGVDLDPMATTLGKASLWLSTQDPDMPSSCLDLNVRTGNSLVGARRETYDAEQLRDYRGQRNKLQTKPIAWNTPFPDGRIYHFLVPDPSMVPFDKDRVMQSYHPEEVRTIRSWRREMSEGYTPAEIQMLLKFSQRIDALWVTLAEAQPNRHPSISSDAKEDPPTASDATLRLRAIMDQWCALWFWPLVEASKLPSRSAWLQSIQNILDTPTPPLSPYRGQFMHWELEFAWVFLQRGGFDLILANPPWHKMEWKETQVLGDLEPSLLLKRRNAKEVAERRDAILQEPDHLATYRAQLEQALGTCAFLASSTHFPTLQGVQPNLYKGFMAKSWDLIAPQGHVGMLHQTGIFNDPQGGAFRHELNTRARFIASFTNALLLFPEVHDLTSFALSVSGASQALADFRLVGHLVHPDTLLASLDHDGNGAVPGIRTPAGEWDLRPHASRILQVGDQELAQFAKLYDAPDTPFHQARIPTIHSQELLGVLAKLADHPKTLGHLDGELFSTLCFDETHRQRDQTIEKEVHLPKEPEAWILSGPHFYISTPFYKNPNPACSHNQDYQPIDLSNIAELYLPRSNYKRACSPARYQSKVPPWGDTPSTSYYRVIARKMIATTGERTLISAILPPGPAHTHGCISFATKKSQTLIALQSFFSSIVADFFIRSTGKSNFMRDLASRLPLIEYGEQSALRTLRLNCLTQHYAQLWRDLWTPSFREDAFTKKDPRLPSSDALNLNWQYNTALRTPYARRQALLEIDVLCAMALELSLEDLLLIYDTQFPVLQRYERETFYDQRGKIVFTTNRGLAGTGLKRKAWTQIMHAGALERLPSWARDRQGPFIPPFDRCDRKADMTQAFAFFSDVSQEKMHSLPRKSASKSA